MLAFLAEVFLISLSGVLAPGPLTAVVLGKGSCSPHAGAFVALGHGVVEIPLMVALLFGTSFIFDIPYVRIVIGILGAILLVIMGIGMLRSLRSNGIQESLYSGSPFSAGILLTAANPYFLVWWATVGVALILGSTRFGIWGFVALVVCHWLCDFACDYFLSALSFKGAHFFGKNYQKVIFAVCGVALLFFAARLFITTLQDILV